MAALLYIDVSLNTSFSSSSQQWIIFKQSKQSINNRLKTTKNLTDSDGNTSQGELLGFNYKETFIGLRRVY